MRQIALLDIVEVATALGLPVRGNRAAASFRGSRDYNIALNRAKGCWRDFKTNQGGGVRQLVEIVLGCDRSAALQWLADRFGVDIGGARSVAERRDYARRLDRARALAEQIAQRRDDYLLDLRTAAGILLTEYHRLLRLADETEDIELVARAADVWELIEVVASRQDRFRSATGPELVALFSDIERKAAA